MEILSSKIPMVIAGRHSQTCAINSSINFIWGCCTENLFLSALLLLFYSVQTQAVLMVATSFQSLSCAQLFATSWNAGPQASLSMTNSQCLLKLIPIESVIPSNHLILCHPILLLPSIISSIRAFSNESALHIRWPKYWSFSFSIILYS